MYKQTNCNQVMGQNLILDKSIIIPPPPPPKKKNPTIFSNSNTPLPLSQTLSCMPPPPPQSNSILRFPSPRSLFNSILHVSPLPPNSLQLYMSHLSHQTLSNSTCLTSPTKLSPTLHVSPLPPNSLQLYMSPLSHQTLSNSTCLPSPTKLSPTLSYVSPQLSPTLSHVYPPNSLQLYPMSTPPPQLYPMSTPPPLSPSLSYISPPNPTLSHMSPPSFPPNETSEKHWPLFEKCPTFVTPSGTGSNTLRCSSRGIWECRGKRRYLELPEKTTETVR